jgi:tetratricopeptide (TPR) repeat protein
LETAWKDAIVGNKKARQRQSAQSNPPPDLLSFDPRLMERQLAAITREMEKHEFATIEEANAYLAQLVASGDVPQPVAETPLEQAQEIMYQALRAQGARRQELAHEALAISPDCADAYVVLAEDTQDPEEARKLFEHGVAAGERALGPEAFHELSGEFWDILETRPYMRARQGLATVLWEQGERTEAIRHATEMLRLNPNDNLGMRYLLSTWLLVTGDDEALGRLLEQYPEDDSANWAYTRVLHTFKRSGGETAEQVLLRAMEVNPYVPFYLLGVAPVPETPPDYYEPGTESEALTYLMEGAEAWAELPTAVEWLADTIVRIASAMQSENAHKKPRPPRSRRRK